MNPSGTSWPHHADGIQPLFQALSQPPGSRVVAGSELSDQSKWTKDRNLIFTLGHEASIREPHEQVQQSWRGRQRPNGIEVYRNGVGHHLAVELIAEHDHVVEFIGNTLLRRI